MLHNAVVLYRRTITFSYGVSTNHKRAGVAHPYMQVKAEADIRGLGGAKGIFALGVVVEVVFYPGSEEPAEPGLSLKVRRCRLATHHIDPGFEKHLAFKQLKVHPF